MALTYLGFGNEDNTLDHFKADAPTATQGGNTDDTAQSIILQSAQFDDVPVPNAEFLSKAVMTQDGQDLIMETPDGLTLIIEGYFSRPDTPDLISPEGNKITPEMVKSFIQAQATDYAQDQLAMNDVSHVGQIGEVNGEAYVLRTDGSKIAAHEGVKIYQGDVIETNGDGAVNLQFIDDSSFAVSSNARLAIDEYVFDPSSYEGTQNFSLLQGAFVYTSGLIGREDPDDVKIETPIGSIGIRGTIIAGNITASGMDSTVTVVEGAIVVANAVGEVTLDQQYETVHFDGMQSNMDVVGVLSPQAMSDSYNVLRPVAADLFSAVDDSAGDHGGLDQPNVDNLDVDAQPDDAAPDANNTDGTEQMHDPAMDDQSFLPTDDSLDFAALTPESGDDYMEQYLEGQQADQIVLSGDAATGGTAGSFSQTGFNTDDGSRNQHEAQDIASPVNIGGGTGGGTGGAANVNHAPTLTGYVAHSDEWSAGTGRQFAFDVKELFSDADGDTLTYTVQNFTVTGGTFPNGTVEPQFEVANPSTLVFTPSAQFTFDTLTVDIYATDASGASSGVYTMNFNIHDSGSFTNIVTGASYTSSSGETIAFGDNVASTLNLSSSTTNNFLLFGGRFDDVMNMNAATNQSNLEFYGGLGNDTMHDFGRGKLVEMVGGGGDDLMIIDNASITGRGFDALVSATAADYDISGGLGRDTIRIGGAGGETLNFSTFSSKIDSIERIETDDGNAQTLNLTAADVIQMTGGKELFIDGDGSDTVNLSGGSFTNTGHTETITEQSGNESSHSVTYTQWLDSSTGVSVYVNEAAVV